MERDSVRAMERLREARGVRSRDLSIGNQLDAIQSRVVVADRAMVRLDEAWGRLVEPGLAARAMVVQGCITASCSILLIWRTVRL